MTQNDALSRNSRKRAVGSSACFSAETKLSLVVKEKLCGGKFSDSLSALGRKLRNFSQLTFAGKLFNPKFLIKNFSQHTITADKVRNAILISFSEELNSFEVFPTCWLCFQSILREKFISQTIAFVRSHPKRHGLAESF